jgi:hypothetical protein
MKHDDDVGTASYRRLITGLLIAAVAAIFLMTDCLETQLLGDINGTVARGIIDEENVIDNASVKFRHRLAESHRRVVSR